MIKSAQKNKEKEEKRKKFGRARFYLAFFGKRNSRFQVLSQLIGRPLKLGKHQSARVTKNESVGQAEEKAALSCIESDSS